MVKKSVKKKPNHEDDILVTRRRQYTRRIVNERNNPVVQELITRNNRYLRNNNDNNITNRSSSSNKNRIVQELVTRNKRYTRKQRRPISANNSVNNSVNNNVNNNVNNSVNNSINNDDDYDRGDDRGDDGDDDSDDDGDNDGDIVEGEMTSKSLKNEFGVIMNNFSGIDSYYCALSQLLSGGVSMKEVIREQIKKFSIELSNKSVVEIRKLTKGERDIIEFLRDNSLNQYPIFLFVTSLLYKFEIVVYQREGRKYKINTTNTKVIFDRVLHIKLKNNKYEGLKKNRRVVNDEFEIEKILNHKNLMKLSDGAEFNVKWTGYTDEHNTMEPWDGLLDTKVFEDYIKNLESRVHGAKKAKKALDIIVAENYGVDVFDPNYNRIRHGRPKLWTKPLKKKFTGKKMKVAVDILNLKGKGGCYCFMPYENIDDNDKALFKIGMTLDFSSRLDEYHTYFPEGVYHVAFLIDPKVEIWDNDKIEEWKNNAKLKKFTKKDVMKAMITQKYKEIEKFLFTHVSENDGRRLYSTVNVRNPDPTTKKGATEWFYTDVGLIHEAFTNAEKEYGGEKLLYYFNGLDPDTGELVESINDMAERRKKSFPNYSGNVLFNV